MEKDAKIYVAGHRGLVGSAIWNTLQRKGYSRLIGRTHQELDLMDSVAVRRFFDEEQPERFEVVLGRKAEAGRHAKRISDEGQTVVW
jgi:nucleoside-diphosphate-sugar epimerase